MTKPPINPAGALAAIEKIRVPNSPNAMRRCVLRIRLISHFAKYDKRDTPIQKGFELISDQVGMHVRTVRAVLDELVADKVLQREPGAGQRANCYRIEPDVRRWRGFEWAVPVSMVEQEVGFATGEFKAETSKTSITAWNARQKRFVEHPMEGRRKRKLSGTSWDGRQREPLSADLPGAMPDKSPSSYKYSRVDEVSSSKEEEEVVNKVASVMKRQTQARFFNGPPLTKLRALVKAGATADELLALLPKLPSDAGVPAAMLWLEQEWHARDVVVDIRPPESAAPAPPIDPLASTIAGLERAGLFDEAEELRQQREEA